MGGECDSYGRGKNCIKMLVETLEGKRLQLRREPK
jgi:hypothetical protein